MIGFVKLFFYKFFNRLRFAFSFIDIYEMVKIQKQSCKRCGVETYYDFHVSDVLWDYLPYKYQSSSLCINCFIKEVDFTITSKESFEEIMIIH